MGFFCSRQSPLPREDFDTIMVFATSSQAHPSPYPDIQVWWLEDGQIASVAQEAA